VEADENENKEVRGKKKKGGGRRVEEKREG
jgi:hypothetical protein